MAIRIKLRYDDYVNWVAATPTPLLHKGEFGIVKNNDDTIVVYVGDSDEPKTWHQCPTISSGNVAQQYLKDLLDVELNTELSEHDILKYDGNKWVNFDLLSLFNIDSEGKIDVASQTFAEQILSTIQTLSECVESCCANTNSIVISNLEDIQNVSISPNVQNGDILTYLNGEWVNSNLINGGTFD